MPVEQVTLQRRGELLPRRVLGELKLLVQLGQHGLHGLRSEDDRCDALVEASSELSLGLQQDLVGVNFSPAAEPSVARFGTGAQSDC